MKEQNESLTPADTAAMLGVINQHLLEALVIIAPMIRMLGSYTAMASQDPPAPDTPKTEIELPAHLIEAMAKAGYKTVADLLRDPAAEIQRKMSLAGDEMQALAWMLKLQGFKISGYENLK